MNFLYFIFDFLFLWDCRQLSRRQATKKLPRGRKLCTVYNRKKVDFMLKLEYK